MRDGDPIYGGVFGDLGGHLSQHGLGAGMGFVEQSVDSASAVVVADHTAERHDRAGSGVGNSRLVLGHRQRRRGDAAADDHGRLPGRIGIGTYGTWAPAVPSVPGSITANPSARASPRSIAEPECSKG